MNWFNYKISTPYNKTLLTQFTYQNLNLVHYTMRKLILLTIILFLGLYNTVAQDIITLKSGDELKGKIIKLNAKDVVFRPQGVNDTLSMWREDIVKLTYQNGTLVYLTDRTIKTGITGTASDSMYFVGVNDASTYYKGYTGAATGTLVSALVFPLNLIPAIACSSTPPGDENLGYTDKKLMENRDYNQGYKEQAYKIKKKKVWKNFAIGSGAVFGLYFLSSMLIATTMVY